MNTIRDYKRKKLVGNLGERLVVRLEKRISEILSRNGCVVRDKDFYFGVLKTGWEYRDLFETVGVKLGKEKKETGQPRFLKVSYNFSLHDSTETPLGAFELNGVVVDMVEGRVVYPGMSRPRQVSDMETIQGIIDDPHLRCSVIINPPRPSPLLTFFCIPGLKPVFVQYGSTSCIRTVSHAMATIPRFEDYVEPILDSCMELLDLEDLDYIDDFLRNTLFLVNSVMVLSIRSLNDGGKWSLFLERGMISHGRFWEVFQHGSAEEVWVNLCLESRLWKPNREIFLREKLSDYVDRLIDEWKGYGDKTGRFVPLRELRIIPEEVGVLGTWDTYVVIFEPTYHFQNYVYENLYPSLTKNAKEHGDELDDVDFLGTPPSREFGDLVDGRVEELLSEKEGVWYHWKDVAFPVAQFWVKKEDRYLECVQEYADLKRRNASGILRSEDNLYLCRRLLAYYLCSPPEHRRGFVDAVARYFAERAVLANLLHNESLPCSPEIRKLRRRYEKCRSLGARKFSIGTYISSLSWTEMVKLIS